MKRLLKLMRWFNRKVMLATLNERLASEKMFKSKYVYEFRKL